MIHVRHLSHSFGPHWALKNCSFSLEKGDFLFLAGPSGAGKTSLLRILYAALPVQRGEAHIAGMDLKKLSGTNVADLRRQVGVVFQDFKILPLRTVQENIALPLEVRGIDPQQILRRVRAVARVLELDTRLSMPCGRLSGGEQQRVAIARSFVVNPQVLLADEPTGNLDSQLSIRLMELFKQFQAYGTTIIFATHSEALMQRHPSARIMRLDQGMITEANWSGAEIFTLAGENSVNLEYAENAAKEAAHPSANHPTEPSAGHSQRRTAGLFSRNKHPERHDGSRQTPQPKYPKQSGDLTLQKPQAPGSLPPLQEQPATPQKPWHTTLFDRFKRQERS